MKKLTYLFFIIIFFVVSCKKDKITETPSVIQFDVDKTTAVVGSELVFSIQANGQKGVIWFGDAASDYTLYKELIANPDTEKNRTKSYPKGVGLDGPTMSGTTPLKHIYAKAGTYTAVIIISNIGDYGDEIKTAEQQLSITITE